MHWFKSILVKDQNKFRSQSKVQKFNISFAIPNPEYQRCVRCSVDLSRRKRSSFMQSLKGGFYLLRSKGQVLAVSSGRCGALLLFGWESWLESRVLRFSIAATELHFDKCGFFGAICVHPDNHGKMLTHNVSFLLLQPLKWEICHGFQNHLGSFVQ